MSRLGTVGLSAFVLAVFVGQVGAEKLNDAADPAAETKKESTQPIEVRTPEEVKRRQDHEGVGRTDSVRI